MTARSLALVTALTFATSAGLVGCKSDSGGSTGNPTPGYVNVSLTDPLKTTYVANGANTVSLDVTDTEGGPVVLTTTRGTFVSSGTKTFTSTGAQSTVVLTTCDAATDSTCAGTVLIKATRGTALDSLTFSFVSLVTACASSCAADTTCTNQACTTTGGASGKCAGTPLQCVASGGGSGGNCTATGATETACGDGLDDDCDGKIDCADSDCNNKQCNASFATYLCQSNACTDTTSGLALVLAPARTRLPADGTTQIAVDVAVSNGGDPAPGLVVNMAASPAVGITPAQATADSKGIAHFTFTAPATPQAVQLTASLAIVPTLTATATITMPALGALAIAANAPVSPTVLGATGSGWNETGYVSVLVLDDKGQPYPDGLPVRFEHRQLGGSTLAGSLALDTATCKAAQGCVGVDAKTSSAPGTADTVGQATAWLQSGRLAGTLATTATATIAGVTRAVALPTVAVVGAKASGANFSVVCGPRNVPALAETDCAVSLVDAPFKCEALLKDRFSNVLGRATQVIFASEVSAVGPVVTTPQYAIGDAGAGLGRAEQTFQTLGAALPFDVAPQAGEAFAVHAQDGCGTRTHNPRDGVVTVIAMADGEEAFFDTNGNGRYDAGEPFVDAGEPFVDQDDNGVHDPGEWFLDVDGDGAWTPPNGAWDASTKLWAQTVVVYTGVPATMQVAANYLGTRWIDFPSWSGACNATQAASPFAVAASQAGPPPVAATSTNYVVVASDLNLNHLAASTNHAVKVAGTVVAAYGGLTKYADDLGFFYRYWPCDKNGVCASQCRATGAAAPCTMKPAVTDFGCGVAAAVTITGGSSPDPALQQVQWNSDTTYSVYGGSKTVLDRSVVVGTSL
ncbi:MAG: hypothetical protein QM704_06660 [Anaeromyxobacteraceae bacterium]